MPGRAVYGDAEGSGGNAPCQKEPGDYLQQLPLLEFGGVSQPDFFVVVVSENLVYPLGIRAKVVVAVEDGLTCKEGNMLFQSAFQVTGSQKRKKFSFETPILSKTLG